MDRSNVYFFKTVRSAFHFRDGKICEAWVIRDRMEIQEQLGMLHGISASR